MDPNLFHLDWERLWSVVAVVAVLALLLITTKLSGRPFVVGILAAVCPSCLGVKYTGEPEAEYFSPSARVYFDIGSDKPDRLDVFRDGSLSPAIDFMSLSWPFTWGVLGPPQEQDTGGQESAATPLTGQWVWGPKLGVGFTGPAGDSEDESLQSSGAPVFFFSAGLMARFDKEPKKAGAKGSVPGVLLEFGWMLGVSPDESLSDATDQALYIGLTASL